MTKNCKLLINKGGKGSTSYRSTLPKRWVKQMGLSTDNRNILMTFDGNKITIEKRL